MAKNKSIGNDPLDGIMENFYKPNSSDVEDESGSEGDDKVVDKQSQRSGYSSNYDLAKLMVIGVGGGGNNAINRMMEAGVDSVELVSINTDAQVLGVNHSDKAVQIGRDLTGGLGAGGNPEIGREAALESQQTLEQLLQDVDMLFITCGMGGGTGTGATPVIADVAQQMEILTTGIVTKPFTFEGNERAEKAGSGLKKLAEKVDTIITISNDKLLEVAPGEISLINAFGLVDEVLLQGVRGISELITVPGMINLDFADIKNAMENGGPALMGLGEAEGDAKTRKAAQNAISSPLLEGSLDGAKKIILNITGGPNLSLEEVTEAANMVQEAASNEADMMFGTAVKEGLDSVKFTIIATGYAGSGPGGSEEEDIREIAFKKSNNGGASREMNDLDIPTFIRRG